MNEQAIAQAKDLEYCMQTIEMFQAVLEAYRAGNTVPCFEWNHPAHMAAYWDTVPQEYRKRARELLDENGDLEWQLLQSSVPNIEEIRTKVGKETEEHPLSILLPAYNKGIINDAEYDKAFDRMKELRMQPPHKERFVQLFEDIVVFEHEYYRMVLDGGLAPR